MYCKDCRFWDNNWYMGECRLIDSVEDSESSVPDNGIAYYATANDDCGLSSGVKTGKLFGCIHFQTKD